MSTFLDLLCSKINSATLFLFLFREKALKELKVVLDFFLLGLLGLNLSVQCYSTLLF